MKLIITKNNGKNYVMSGVTDTKIDKENGSISFYDENNKLMGREFTRIQNNKFIHPIVTKVILGTETVFPEENHIIEDKKEETTKFMLSLKMQQKIEKYLKTCDTIEKIKSMTLKSIASESGVSTKSVQNYFNEKGFRGIKEFKINATKRFYNNNFFWKGNNEKDTSSKN